MHKTVGDIMRALPPTMGTLGQWAAAPQIIVSTNVTNSSEADFNCYSDTVHVFNNVGELDAIKIVELGLPFKQARIAIMDQAVDVSNPSSSHVFYAGLLFKLKNYDQVQGRVSIEVIRCRGSASSFLDVFV